MSPDLSHLCPAEMHRKSSFKALTISTPFVNVKLLARFLSYLSNQTLRCPGMTFIEFCCHISSMRANQLYSSIDTLINTLHISTFQLLQIELVTWPLGDYLVTIRGLIVCRLLDASCCPIALGEYWEYFCSNQ